MCWPDLWIAIPPVAGWLFDPYKLRSSNKKYKG